MSSGLPDTSARRAPENLAILLREPFVVLSDRLIERLAARGHPEVRYAHGAVFQYLDDAGTRVSVLAARARIAKQSMAELVAHLERHGYVERVADPADGRAKLVPGDGAAAARSSRSPASWWRRWTRGSTRRSGRRGSVSCARCWRTCARRSPTGPRPN